MEGCEYIPHWGMGQTGYWKWLCNQKDDKPHTAYSWRTKTNTTSGTVGLVSPFIMGSFSEQTAYTTSQFAYNDKHYWTDYAVYVCIYIQNILPSVHACKLNAMWLLWLYSVVHSLHNVYPHSVHWEIFYLYCTYIVWTLIQHCVWGMYMAGDIWTSQCTISASCLKHSHANC